MYDLTCIYDSRLSFYGKAKVLHENGEKVLYSYNTQVASIDYAGTLKVFNTQSATTVRHIREFMLQNGFERMTKAQIEKNYLQ
jgi:hypothetical protein